MKSIQLSGNGRRSVTSRYLDLGHGGLEIRVQPVCKEVTAGADVNGADRVRLEVAPHHRSGTPRVTAALHLAPKKLDLAPKASPYRSAQARRYRHCQRRPTLEHRKCNCNVHTIGRYQTCARIRYMFRSGMTGITVGITTSQAASWIMTTSLSRGTRTSALATES